MIKYTNQKTETIRVDKETRPSYMLCMTVPFKYRKIKSKGMEKDKPC